VARSAAAFGVMGSVVRVSYWDRRKAANALTALWLQARVAIVRARRRLGLAPAQAPPNVAYPKIFVVGCPRSGTSWITAMLQRHPLAIGTAESHAYSTVAGPFLERQRRGAAGWRRVLTRYDLMASRPWGVGLQRYVDRPTLCRLIREARVTHGAADLEAAEAVIAKCFDHFFFGHGGTAARVLVEKTPQHLFYADRLLSRFPEARIVEVIRDGRDVCVSLEDMAQRHFWPPADRRRQVETWLRYVSAGRGLAAQPQVADRVLTVRYEAAWAAPTDTLARVFAFAGLRAEPALVETIVAECTFARAPRTGPGRPRRKGTVGDWRNQFTAAEAQLFERLAGDTARALGYGGECPP
jgi:hypothetical protein